MTQIPIVSIVGRSGAGKTALIEKLVPVLTGRGLKVGTVKHDTHGFEMDSPGKDSWRHKKAGAVTTIISSPKKIGMVKDADHDHALDELALMLPGLDIILAEGYKREDKPKVEVFRSTLEQPPLCGSFDNLIAVFADGDINMGVPHFAADNIEGLADLILTHFEIVV